METKKILLIIGSVIGLLAFLFGAYYFTSQPQQTYFEQLTQVKETDHTKWSKNNKILLHEFSDFQCPACASYYGLFKSFEENPENKDIMEQVTFIYRNFPLDQIHPNAREAAYAAEAAANQNAFFIYHDLLFEKQTEWENAGDPSALFLKYAEDLELNVEQFQKDYESDEIQDRVQADYLSGVDVDVQGTPTFYLNGYKIRSPQTPEELRQILLSEIQKASN